MHRRHTRGSHGSHTRWPAQALRRRDGVTRILAQLALHEGGRGGVNERLGLVLHPLLIVELHILLVLPPTAVGLPHTGRVVGEVGVAIVTVKLGHPRQKTQV